jgi:diguanylate cyclase (GGDEF)-like protein/PAS domain S-box-containing protein
VLDASAQVVLANDAFCALHGDDPKTLTGLAVPRLAWLKHALGDRKPWAQVMSSRDNIAGMNLSVSTPQGSRELVVNCAPILDGRRLRGCLMSFSDVTDLHERTERLRVALQDLRRSQEEVQQKNAELSLLANRDALTGINNRRALMDQAQQAFERARATGEPLACIMCDIDHFKLVNDRYGHAGGDQVIQGAARLLQQGLRVTDVVGRYGGEEFCIMLPTSHSATAADMANGIRVQIEATLGSALTEHPGVQVTMSFGVAELMPGLDHPGALIDRADQALYHAKKTGRNRVSTWPVPAVE